MNTPKKKKSYGRVAIAALPFVIILAVLVYANALRNNFILDDFSIVVNNDFVKSFRNLPLLFSKSYLTAPGDLDLLGIRYIGSGETTYRPMVTISYFFDYALWKKNPFGYHLGNLLLHILNILLLYSLAILLVKNKTIALIGALLFAVHPVNAEVVNTISFREDLLAFMFFISSLILYIRADSLSGKNKTVLYFSALSLFFLALFSKEMAITLPAILFLYDYYFVLLKNRGEIWHRFKSRYLGYIGVCLFYLWTWAILIGFTHHPKSYFGINSYSRIFTMSKVLINYIKWLLFPFDVHTTLPDDLNILTSNLSTPVLFNLIIIIACFVLAIRIYKRSRLASFLMLWFFITLLPVYNIVPLYNFMASRYLYIPLAGPCILLSVLLYRPGEFKLSAIAERIINKTKIYITVIIITGFSFATVIRNYSMNNNISLCLELIKFCPKSSMAHRNLGYFLMQNKHIDAAINEHKIAVSLNPLSADNHDGLGICYLLKGDLDSAVLELKKAINLDQNFVRAYANLGVVLIQKGSYKEALFYFEKALKIDPKFSPARDNIGNLRKLIGP